MLQNLHSPDLGVSAGGELVAAAKPKKKKGYTPGSDDDFTALANLINASWQQNPKITLAWISREEFGDLCRSFALDLEERKSAGGGRPFITSTLRGLNKQMDTAVSEVKIYIERKFKKLNAVPQFARYGIVKNYGSYMLPRDHFKRLQHLNLMLAAISKDGFADEEYGVGFWLQMKEQFSAALHQSIATDGLVSGKVSSKNSARQQLDKAMVALRMVLMANFPDSYPSVFREWGWQKQNY